MSHYNHAEVGMEEVIIITSVPIDYADTFTFTVGKLITAKKTGFGGWHISVSHDVADNPGSIWKGNEDVTLFFPGEHARAATTQEIREMVAPLTGYIANAICDNLEASFINHIRATSRDNPFRHWNRIKGNRKIGMPEVLTMKELRA